MTVCLEFSLTNLIVLSVVFFTVKRLFGFYQKWRLEKMLEKWKNSSIQDKIILHTVPRCKTIPSFSPFAMKLETFLRMAKIPYELDTTNPMGPKDLNKHMSLEQMAITRACRIVMEEHFAWGSKQFRWIENYHKFPQIMKVSPIFKFFLSYQAYQIKKRMDVQGIGKHTAAEIHLMCDDDLYTVSRILGHRKFFGGDETPCEDDCAIFGGISQAYWGMQYLQYSSDLKCNCRQASKATGGYRAPMNIYGGVSSRIFIVILIASMVICMSLGSLRKLKSIKG